MNTRRSVASLLIVLAACALAGCKTKSTGADGGVTSLGAPGAAIADASATLVATASPPSAAPAASAKAAVGAKPSAAKPKAVAAAADAPCPGPGLTRRCGGKCVNIQTDDRNCGSCGTVCPAGKRCDGHMFCRDAAGNL